MFKFFEFKELKKWVPQALLAMATIGLIYSYFHQSPIEQVLRTLKELSTELSIRPNENPLEKIKITNQIVQKFGQPFEVIVPVDRHPMTPLTHHKKLKERLLILRRYVREMKIQFTNLETLEELETLDGFKEETNLITVKGKNFIIFNPPPHPNISI